MSGEPQDWKVAPYPTARRGPQAELLREYSSLAAGVAEVLDDLDHLLGEAEDDEAGRLGLLRRKLAQVLLLHGIRPTARQGQSLDLRFHEVVGTEPRGDLPPDTVTTIVKHGYEVLAPGFEPMLLRCAKVIVSAAPGAQSEGTDASAARGTPAGPPTAPEEQEEQNP